MTREENLTEIVAHKAEYDIIIIGGGSAGFGVALDAGSRGFSCLLLEQSDFGKGTSSRSTKLAHGGVRYLAQGNISLVLEALKERGLMLKNAPHLVKNQSFIIPMYSWFDSIKYTIGLKLYDLLSGSLSFGKSYFISKTETLKRLPTINSKKLKGGVVYHDGQFDDTRLLIDLAKTCESKGVHVINYTKVTSLLKDENDRIIGVKFIDKETGIEYSVNAKAVVNATGVFSDFIHKMDKPTAKKTIIPSQGVHLVLDKSFLASNDALLIPKTSDGRVLFAVPWHDKLIVGTTDTPMLHPSLEPVALEKEIDFILKNTREYLTQQPNRSDILSVYAGLRPLAAPSKEGSKTKEISRSHKVLVSKSNLITITGGKWTTFRKMGEDTVDAVIRVAKLSKKESNSSTTKIHGYIENTDFNNYLSVYGTDISKIQKLIELDKNLTEKLHKNYPFIRAEVVHAVRNEMARTIEDFLARRIRILLLDAKVACEMAPLVAEIMAVELNKDQHWQDEQILEFATLAKNYRADLII